VRPAKPVKLDLLARPCFYDVDVDGKLDCVGLIRDPNGDSRWEDRVAWRKNLGGDPPQFGRPNLLDKIDVKACTFTAAVTDGPRRGLLVSHNYSISTSFFEQPRSRTAGMPLQTVPQNPKPLENRPRFVQRPLLSDSAVISSDSNGCFPCDWDGDGDWDVLYGGSYG